MIANPIKARAVTHTIQPEITIVNIAVIKPTLTYQCKKWSNLDKISKYKLLDDVWLQKNEKLATISNKSNHVFSELNLFVHVI